MRSLVLACVLLVSTAAPAIAPGAAAQTAPSITRRLAWDGSQRLAMNLGGDLTYTQSPSIGVTVTGDPELVPHVVIRNGTITVDPEWAKTAWNGHRTYGRVNVMVTAPYVENFVFNSSGKLEIRNYSRDRLHLTVNGHSAVRVSGAAPDLHCQLNGAGSVNLKDLSVGDARVVIPGSGDVSLGARGHVNVTIIGSGELRLLNAPASLQQRIIGSGRVIRPGEA
jgi:hypothetical protein